RRRQVRRRRRGRGPRAGSEPGHGAARGIPARAGPDGGHDHAEPGDVRPGGGGTESPQGTRGEPPGTELRRQPGGRRGPAPAGGAGPGRGGRMDGTRDRPAIGGGKTMNKNAAFRAAFLGLTVWLAGLGAALAQANSIDGFDVVQQGDKVLVRVTTKEPL